MFCVFYFALPQVMNLWDVAWTQVNTEEFVMFAAAAVLDLNEVALSNKSKGSDEMLEALSHWVTVTDIQAVLDRARAVSLRCSK